MAATTQQPVVLVTGCSTGGIGFELCEEFATRRCLVYATSRKLETMEGFKNKDIRKLVLDITNGDDIDRVVHTILSEAGKIDIVVNNAGALSISPLAEATMEQIRNTFELNTFGALRLSNAVIPSMFERRQGLIINIGSIAAIVPVPWNTLYCATKAALHTISEGLAMECKPFGVKVMLVAPGSVLSNIAKNQAIHFELSPTSVYKAYEPKMAKWLNNVQNPGSMDTKEFARRVVAQALRENPPSYMTLGQNATLCYFLQWLPRWFVLGLVYRSFVGYKRTM